MKLNFLEFEQPIAELEAKIDELRYVSNEKDINISDEIEIKGKVFSDALGDAWIDVSELKIIKKAPETKKN